MKIAGDIDPDPEDDADVTSDLEYDTRDWIVLNMDKNVDNNTVTDSDPLKPHFDETLSYNSDLKYRLNHPLLVTISSLLQNLKTYLDLADQLKGEVHIRSYDYFRCSDMRISNLLAGSFHTLYEDLVSKKIFQEVTPNPTFTAEFFSVVQTQAVAYAHGVIPKVFTHQRPTEIRHEMVLDSLVTNFPDIIIGKEIPLILPKFPFWDILMLLGILIKMEWRLFMLWIINQLIQNRKLNQSLSEFLLNSSLIHLLSKILLLETKAFSIFSNRPN